MAAIIHPEDTEPDEGDMWLPQRPLQWRHNEHDGVSNHPPRDTIVYSGANQRKQQSFASLAFVWGSHRWPVNFPHKWPVTRKKFPFDDVIMSKETLNDTDKIESPTKRNPCEYFIGFAFTVGLWV